MKSTVDVVESVLADIIKLESPKIEGSRVPQLREFIRSTVNGDEAQEYLCINANLGANNRGTITYILTNVRIIKIDVDAKEIQSSSYALDSILNIDRKLIAPDRAEVRVVFQNDAFGLRYSQNDQKITDFFQKIDQARIPPTKTSRGG